jgi:guanylate kinase
MKKGKLFIISGPSAGVGKATIIDGVLADKSLNIIQCQTYTTRKPRGEKSDEQYIFVTADKFEKAIANREMLEYNFLDGNYYGTHKQTLYDNLESGKNIILEIEIGGAMEIKKIMPSVKTIFIFADVNDIEKRIRKRGENSEEQIQKRLEIAREELRHKDLYDYQVENPQGMPQAAISKVKEIIRKNIN